MVRSRVVQRPHTIRREEECKSCKHSFLPIEGFLSLCELAMNLSSHQIIVSWRERSSSDMPVNLILIFFSSSSKYLILSVNFRSVLICYTTLPIRTKMKTRPKTPSSRTIEYLPQSLSHCERHIIIYDSVGMVMMKKVPEQTMLSRVNEVAGATRMLPPLKFYHPNRP